MILYYTRYHGEKTTGENRPDRKRRNTRRFRTLQPDRTTIMIIIIING